MNKHILSSLYILFFILALPLYSLNAEVSSSNPVKEKNAAARLLNEIQHIPLSKMTHDELLAVAAFYGWANDKETFMKRLTSEKTGIPERETAILFLDAAGDNKWSTFLNVSSLSQNSMKLIPAELPDILKKHIAGNTIASLKSATENSGIWLYVYAGYLFSDREFDQSGKLFDILYKKYAGSMSKPLRIFADFARAMKEWSALCKWTDQNTVHAKKISFRKKPRLTTPSSNAWINLPAFSQKDTLEFYRMLKNTAGHEKSEYISCTVEYLNNGNNIQFVSRKNKNTISLLIKNNNKPVMQYENSTLNLFDDQNRYSLKKEFNGYEDIPIRAGFQISTTAKNIFFGFNFSDDNKGIVDTREIISTISKNPVPVIMSTKDTYRIHKLNPFRPLSDSVLEMSFKKGTLNGLSSVDIKTGRGFVLKNITTAPSGDSNNTDIPQSEIVKPEKIIEFALPSISLKQILNYTVNRNQTSTSIFKSDSDLKIVKEYINDLEALGRADIKTLAAIGDKYRKIADNRAIPNVYYMSALFYFEAYEFAAAEKLIDQYFSRDESVTDPDTLNISFDSEAIISKYIQTLIQLGKYDKAEIFLEGEVHNEAASVDKSKYVFLLMERAFLHLYQGKTDTASEEFGTISRIKDDNNLNSDALSSIIIARVYYFSLLNYRGKYQEAAKLRNDKDISKMCEGSDFSGWPDVKEKGVRLKNLIPIMHQGRNYCAPVAIQNALRYLNRPVISQKEIAAELGITADGATFDVIMRYFSNHSIGIELCGHSLPDITDHLNNGRPVFALFEGHITTITGVDVNSKILYLSEPDTAIAISTQSENSFLKHIKPEGYILFTFTSDIKPDEPVRGDKLLRMVFAYRYMDSIYSHNKITASQLKELDTALDKIERNDTQGTYSYFVRKRRLLNLRIKQSSKFQFTTNDIDYISSIKEKLDQYNDPDDFFQYRVLGEILANMQKFDEALSSLNKAVALNPRDILSYYLRKNIHVYQKNYAQAEANLLKILKLSTELSEFNYLNKDSLYNLAQIEFERNNVQKCLEYLIKGNAFHDENHPASKAAFDLLKKTCDQPTIDFVTRIIVNK